MNQKTETILLAFTAAVSSSMSIPAPETDIDELPELTDEQLAVISDSPLPEITRGGYDLLAAIHGEEKYFQTIAEQNRKDEWEETEQQQDKGLKTEINRSTSLVNVAESLDGCSEVLRRHPYGYKHGSRDSKGHVIVEPYTAAENEAAEKWLASVGLKG